MAVWPDGEPGMIAKLSPRTERLLTLNETAYPGDAGLRSALAAVSPVVDSLAREFSFTFHLAPSPAALGSDPAVVLPRLLAETEGWLGFVLHSVGYRLGQLVDDAVTGLNGHRPYRTVNAARSLVELSAFVHHYAKLIVAAARCSADSQQAPEVVESVVSTMAEARHFAQVTRFNWAALARGDDDEFYSNWSKVEDHHKAPQILTLIDKLPGEEKRAARFFYEMLCDFVHPNVGSHVLVVDGTRPMPGHRMEWHLKKEPDSDEALAVTLHVVAIPLRAAIRTIVSALDDLKRILQYFSEWRRKCDTGEVG